MKHKLEADGIQLSFDGRVILSDIYLQCETGIITGLLGRNGSGKSCLMKIIYGSLPCERSVRFDSISQSEVFKRPDLLHYLPQFTFIPKGLTLQRIFNDFELEYSSFGKRFPEFASLYKSSVKSLSGGERRLVELYIIVKSKSQFAMLDEPFTHLSPIQIERAKELLIEEKGNKGILITDHLYQHVTGICDSIFVLSNGKTNLAKSIEDIETFGYVRL